MGQSDSDWLFGPQSLMWKINREGVLLLGSRPALLMQLAHPLVAAGVAEHSTYSRDLLGRLQRTMGSMLTIVFGDRVTAERTIGRIGSIHERVRGTAPDGTAYFARDPRLMAWVYATLVDSSVSVYQSCIGSLTEREIAAYYEECKVIGRMLAIPEALLPETLEALRHWMRQMIESREVEVTPLARELAQPILRPLRVLPHRVAVSAAFVTAALLPPEIREGYGLKLTRPASLLVGLGGRASRAVIPRMPAAVRTFPLARVAGRPPS